MPLLWKLIEFAITVVSICFGWIFGRVPLIDELRKRSNCCFTRRHHKDSPRHARSFPVHQAPVKNTLVLAVAEYLKQNVLSVSSQLPTPNSSSMPNSTSDCSWQNIYYFIHCTFTFLLLRNSNFLLFQLHLQTIYFKLIVLLNFLLF